MPEAAPVTTHPLPRKYSSTCICLSPTVYAAMDKAEGVGLLTVPSTWRDQTGPGPTQGHLTQGRPDYLRTCACAGLKMRTPLDIVTGAISIMGNSASALMICHWIGFCCGFGCVHRTAPLPIQAHLSSKTLGI